MTITHLPHRKADRPRAALSGLRHGHDTLRLRLVIARYHAGCSDDATARCAAMQSKVLQHGHVLLEERRFETRLGAPHSSRLPMNHSPTGGPQQAAEVPSFTILPLYCCHLAALRLCQVVSCDRAILSTPHRKPPATAAPAGLQVRTGAAVHSSKCTGRLPNCVLPAAVP